jgi:hypothetical protein
MRISSAAIAHVEQAIVNKVAASLKSVRLIVLSPSAGTQPTYSVSEAFVCHCLRLAQIARHSGKQCKDSTDRPNPISASSGTPWSFIRL